MKVTPITTAVVLSGCVALALAACTADTPAPGQTTSGTSDSAGTYTTQEVSDGTTTFTVVDNPGAGATLSYSADSGIKLLTEVVDGSTYAFKDMNANGKLDVWEDWRQSVQDRAADLAKQLPIEQIAGLMLFGSNRVATADGLTDDVTTYVSDNNIRSMLSSDRDGTTESNVTFVNAIQAYVESLASADSPYIPMNFGTDPRAQVSAQFQGISSWPDNLGLAATFDPDIVEQFANTTAAEFRALGISTLLGPQVDLSSDPRWPRDSDTFGEDADMSAELAAAYIAAYQDTSDADGNDVGWGSDSVVTMMKHFPGDGEGEGGRESHNAAGEYAVYPGDNLDEQLKPFVAGLDSLAVMTSYSVALDADGNPLFGESVGSAFDKGKLDILRIDNGYDGIICTDWDVMTDGGADGGKDYGVDDLTVEERHYAALQAGVDMFGGDNDIAPVMAAYDMWQADYEAGTNDVDADTRFRESGTRILEMLFAPGLFENPYLDLDSSLQIVDSADKVAAGLEAQVDSIVMLKNDGQAIASAQSSDWSDKTVYIPRSYATKSQECHCTDYTEYPTLDLDLAAQYFGKVVTDDPVLDADGKVVSYTVPDLSDVDLVLVGMDSPYNGGVGDAAGYDAETDTYYPLSLQYRPYTATGAGVRKVSISGDTLADGTKENRSYYGETSRIGNEADLDAVERAVSAVTASGKDIPVIVALKALQPVVPAEFEADVDAIVVGFGVTEQALFEVALGLHEPQGRLPITFPASMDAVEAQLEDVGDDTAPYVDATGNAYAFGFGLNWSGVIGG